KVTFKENGVERSVYRDVNSGGSFGSNPLLQHIGIGTATTIESIEVKWPATNTTQVFKNLQPDQSIRLKENAQTINVYHAKPIDFVHFKKGLIDCAPLLKR